MVLKLDLQAEKHGRRLNSYQLPPQVIRGVLFIDRVRKKSA